MSHHPRQHRHWFTTIAFTSFLLGLIALAIGGTSPGVSVAAVLSVVALASALHFLLPGSGFFSAVFANAIGIYACFFAFLVSANFGDLSPAVGFVGFVLPLAGFLAGLLWHRADIVRTLRAEEKTGLNFYRSLAWILPLVAIGMATFFIPIMAMIELERDLVLLGFMSIIALIALIASRDITVFLLDTGLLFEGFFSNAVHLAKPAFAFFTWYSLLAIIFGCLYTILDRFSGPHFVIGGDSRPLTFGEGLYVSVVTLSTVGYGDIIAVTPASRLLVSGEILTGVLLLLFGVQAILTSRSKD